MAGNADIERQARENWKEIVRLNDRIRLGKCGRNVGATQAALDRRMAADVRFTVRLINSK